MRERTLAAYVVNSKYGKHLGNRRENYDEIVDRYLSTFDMAESLRAELRAALISKKIYGSMRGMQFGGEAVLRKNARIYNCSSSYCDRPAFFGEALWLLLCGTGVGFSVQSHHVGKLPALKERQGSYVHRIDDSIEGWAWAVHSLMNSFFEGSAAPLFDYSAIRPAGSPISHGGKAPGPDGLRDALERVEAHMLSTRKLKPIDCFDIMGHISNAVLSGGIRRAAMMITFDADDEDMLNSKTGDWFTTNPQRARANISAVILPHHDKEVFARVFESTKQFGEPGFLFMRSREYVVNPCSEITMCPVLITENGIPLENYTLDILENREERYTYESGWSMCNLSGVNCAAITPDEFTKYVRLATILGTYQASKTDLGYLGEVSEEIVRREALLGVSLTGVYSNRAYLDADLLSKGAETARLVNKFYASELGIREASRICCVKPEGTASLALDVVSSGMHPYHASRYIRRVQATASEDLYQYIERVYPQSCEKSVWGGDNLRVISFACEAPATAVVRSQLSLKQHLQDVLTVNQHWVRKGVGLNRCEQADHNVSVTFSVQSDEWEWLKDELWENRAMLTGVSMLSAMGDYVYEQAPLQEVYESDDPKVSLAYSKWKELRGLPDLDLSEVVELEDNTDFAGEAACAGGACLVPLYESPTDVSPTDVSPTDVSPTDVSSHAAALLLEIAEHLLRDDIDLFMKLKALLTK